MHSSFEKCRLVNIDDNSFEAPCSFNLYSKNFEVLVSEEAYNIDVDKVKKIEMLKDTFYPVPLAHRGELGNYLVVLAESNEVSLIKIYKLNVKQVSSPVALGLYETKLTITDHLYFRFKNDNFCKVPSSNKKIHRLLTENHISIPENIKKHKIKNVKTLVTIVNAQ